MAQVECPIETIFKVSIIVLMMGMPKHELDDAEYRSFGEAKVAVEKYQKEYCGIAAFIDRVDRYKATREEIQKVAVWHKCYL